MHMPWLKWMSTPMEQAEAEQRILSLVKEIVHDMPRKCLKTKLQCSSPTQCKCSIRPSPARIQSSQGNISESLTKTLAPWWTTFNQKQDYKKPSTEKLTTVVNHWQAAPLPHMTLNNKRTFQKSCKYRSLKWMHRLLWRTSASKETIFKTWTHTLQDRISAKATFEAAVLAKTPIWVQLYTTARKN